MFQQREMLDTVAWTYTRKPWKESLLVKHRMFAGWNNHLVQYWDQAEGKNHGLCNQPQHSMHRMSRTRAPRGYDSLWQSPLMRDGSHGEPNTVKSCCFSRVICGHLTLLSPDRALMHSDQYNSNMLVPHVDKARCGRLLSEVSPAGPRQAIHSRP